MTRNFILGTDAYKLTHWMQYPKDTQCVYSYCESRGGKFDYTTFFGLQAFLKEYMVGPVVEPWMLDEAKSFCKGLFGTDKYLNEKGWRHLLEKHSGRLPLLIKAVPEGTSVPTRQVLVTVQNTDPALPWLTNFAETLLLQAVWYGTTVCTLSRAIKQNIQDYAKATGGEVGPFHLNDFGFRGVSSKESAGIGGAAHLVNFLGTDTLEGIRFAQKYYSAGPCGHSVIASEHSTTTIYGRDGEHGAFEHFIGLDPNGIVSIVIDSYDTVAALDKIASLKDKILARPGRVVVRPDSGDPAQMSVACLEKLWRIFGGTETALGYRVLNPKIGVIYGDGINYESITSILLAAKNNKFAAHPGNLVFGMGGALLQQLNRDTQKFAFKCSAANVGGEWRDVFKQPSTDPGKDSKRGRLKLVKTDNGWKTVSESSSEKDELLTVFSNGNLENEYKWDEIRQNAQIKF